MTMFASSKATKEAFEYNRIFQEQIRLQRIKSFLLGVRTEINAVIEMYESEYLEVSSIHKDGTPLDWIYPLDQNYFNFYENNASTLGELEDNSLRELIIQTYLMGNMIISTHVYNNEMLNERNNLETLRAQQSVNNYSSFSALGERIKTLNRELSNYAPNFKVNYHKARSLIDSLNQKIDSVTEHIDTTLLRIYHALE